jgi:ribosome-binding ATPase YchF (GTP1/OBG family)
MKEVLGISSNEKVDDGIINLIHEGYKMLGLETFFTTGEVETRA